MTPDGELVVRDGLSFVGRCRPASRCGGDFWTFRDLPDGRTLLLIGDATGYGVRAATIAATAEAACDVAARTLGGLGTARVLEIMNRAVHDAARGGLLVTCFAAAIDARARRVTFSNAGHEFPFVLRRAPARTTLSLPGSGDPLGVQPDARYDEQTVALEPGDALVLYTDGVIERRDAGEQAFGEKRLRRTLERHADDAPEDLLAAVLAETERFGAGTEPADDVAVVVGRLA